MTRSLPSVWDACVFPARAIIARAVERGINYLDTAYLYPGNEACVGAALEELGCRDRVLVATKLPHASCRRPEDPDRIFGEQLRRLRTDYVDYYLMHNVTSPAQWERLRDLGIEDWFARQRAAGRIRQVGFSYHGSADDFPVLLDAYDWDFCQIQYNYTGERYQAGTAGLLAAHARRMAVFVMEPLLGGRLADKLPRRARRILDDLQSHITSGNIELFKLNSPAELIALSSTIRTFDTVSGNIQAVGTDDYSYLDLDELRQLSAAIQATISLLSISYDLGNR